MLSKGAQRHCDRSLSLDIASYYSHHDFEDESDYQKFIGKNRTVLIRSIDNVCKTNSQLAIAIRIGFDYADYCFQPGNLSNLLLFESLVAYWQIIEKHLRVLLKPGEPFNHSKTLADADEPVFCQRGQALIEQLLSITGDNLEFLAYSLRLLTCLYVFTRGEHSWTQRILGHLFRTITTERQSIPAVHPLQKQASCLIDLCLNYGRSIFIYFNDLFQVTQNLIRQQTAADQQMKLAGWQWSVLVECLAILLNHFESFQQQAVFIDQLVQPFAEILTKFNTTVNDLPTFVDYIGLKSTPDGKHVADTSIKPNFCMSHPPPSLQGRLPRAVNAWSFSAFTFSAVSCDASACRPIRRCAPPAATRRRSKASSSCAIPRRRRSFN